MTTQAAIYTRISRLDPRRDKDDPTRAVKRQEADCRKFAEAKGWDVAKVYTDEDLSASKEDVIRPGYERLKRDAATGDFDVVVCWKIDRIGRKTSEVLEFVEELDAHGVKFASVEDAGIDTTGPSGRLVLTVMAAIAQFEVEQMTLRMRREREALAEAGRPHHGGKRAFGWERDGVTEVPEEVALIREAATRYVDEGWSLRAIAEDWNERGHLTPDGNEWRGAHVGRLLLSDRVAGRRRYHDRTFPAAWDAVLDDEEQAAIRLKRPGRGRPAAEPHLLTGILRCGTCGEGMNHHSSTKGGPRYRCVNRDCAKHVSVKADEVEEPLWRDAIAKAHEHEEEDAAGIDQRLDRARSELAATRRSLLQLTEDYYRHRTVPEDEYRPTAAGLRDDVSTLEAEVADLESRRDDRWAILRARAGVDLDAEGRRALLKRVIRRMELAPAKPGKYFDPDRVRITWADGAEQVGFAEHDLGAAHEPGSGRVRGDP